MSIAITTSVKSLLTWRKFPDKEANEVFWKGLCKRSRSLGFDYGQKQIAYVDERGTDWLSTNNKWALHDGFLVVRDGRGTFSSGDCHAAHHACLNWRAAERLKAADYKWIHAYGGRYDQELWDNFWLGYNEALIEYGELIRFPREGELVRDFQNDRLLVCLSENDNPQKWEQSEVNIRFYDSKTSQPTEIGINDWIVGNAHSNTLQVL